MADGETWDRSGIDGGIDRDSPMPYYHQLKELVRDEIVSGRWTPGTRIPSELELCALFDVSRTVVRQALGELENERLLLRRKGLGTFVAEPKIRGQLVQTLTGFHDDMTEQGRTPHTVVLNHAVVRAPSAVAAQLEIPVGTDVVRIERLRSVDHDPQPIVLVTTWIPLALCPPLAHADLGDRSLYAYLAETGGLHIAYGRRTLEAIAAAKTDVALLGVEEGDPLLFLRSVTFLANGLAVEYYEAKHRGDRTVLEVDLVRPGVASTS
ncbi:MAG: GntR family transcriptional regulator [Trueperaceae bacterium]|nr:GntR family transcriptional regulator [Trueperaceae bacterium]